MVAHPPKERSARPGPPSSSPAVDSIRISPLGPPLLPADAVPEEASPVLHRRCLPCQSVERAGLALRRWIRSGSRPCAHLFSPRHSSSSAPPPKRRSPRGSGSSQASRGASWAPMLGFVPPHILQEELTGTVDLGPFNHVVLLAMKLQAGNRHMKMCLELDASLPQQAYEDVHVHTCTAEGINVRSNWEVELQ